MHTSLYSAKNRENESEALAQGVLFCSVLQPSSIRGLATPWTYFLHLSLSSVILIDSSTGSTVHVLMLSVQAVRGLPRLPAHGTASLFLQATPVFPHGVTTVASFLALTVSNSSLFAPALLKIHSLG